MNAGIWVYFPFIRTLTHCLRPYAVWRVWSPRKKLLRDHCRTSALAWPTEQRWLKQQTRSKRSSWKDHFDPQTPAPCVRQHFCWSSEGSFGSTDHSFCPVWPLETPGSAGTAAVPLMTPKLVSHGDRGSWRPPVGLDNGRFTPTAVLALETAIRNPVVRCLNDYSHMQERIPGGFYAL